MDLTVLVNYTPYVLLLGGLIETSWLWGRILGLKPLGGSEESLKVTSVIGFFVGALSLVTGVVVWWEDAFDPGTRFLILLVGLALFLSPLKDVPWAALVGLVVGSLCVGAVFLFFPLTETVFGVSSTWIYLAIFFIPALLTYLFFKFLEDVLKLIAIILSFKPVATTIGAACIIQGILLLLDSSLFTTL
jgi:hypothetical protein